MSLSPPVTRGRLILAPWLETADNILKTRLLPLGLFVQLTGMLWIGSKGGYITQTYLWCLLPGVISLGIDLYRFGLRSCIAGMTTGEKLLCTLFIWILVNPLFTTEGIESIEVIKRVAKIAVYIYVVRTVIIYNRKPEKLLLVAATVATGFALATMIYQFGMLGHPMGIRALGEGGYRVGSLGIGEFGSVGNPILAALYYGTFASIFCGYLASRPFRWQRRIPAIIGVGIIGVFILLSGSRGPLMAFVAMGGMALLLCQYSWKKPLLGILFIAGVGFSAWQFDIIVAQYDSVIASGFNGRFVNWEMAVNYIRQQPVFGYGTFAEYVGPVWHGGLLGHPHNMLLNITYSWGVPAGLLFIAISAWSIFISLAHRKSLMMAIAGCLIVFGQVGMFTDTYSFLSRPDVQWLVFFFPVALCSAIKKAP
ncbi:O-antigen ligase family protein [Parendozoicomonas sp. Alg238-R29]|uniref:O-antigen ligase family protein n=1 Tax=Parendozoicomonas sp. Alg238-R29 TaxID=2993446 RepID=UPI00248E82D5|nr:O-antigen ligase family protein [Parendozoicomonas sp. Alg238-R29]